VAGLPLQTPQILWKAGDSFASRGAGVNIFGGQGQFCAGKSRYVFEGYPRGLFTLSMQKFVAIALQ
jgi:hypothetical protein